jgi:hypothetical protein
MRKLCLLLISLIALVCLAPFAPALTVPLHLNAETTSGTSDNNGILFDSTVAGGTNYSLSSNNSNSCAAHVTINNSTITATITTTSITFSGGYTTSTTDVGNFVNIVSTSGGTPPTLQRYKIIARPDSTHWTLSASSGASAATITSAFMGGCAPLNQNTFNLAASAVAGTDPIIDIKQGTYSVTGGLTTGGAANVQLIGYKTTPGDLVPGTTTSADWPIVQTTGTSINAWTWNSGNSLWSLKYMVLDGTSCTSCGAATIASNSVTFQYVKFTAWGLYGVLVTAGNSVFNEVEFNNSGDGSHGAIDTTVGVAVVTYSYFHGNVAAGASGVLITSSGGGATITHSLFACNSNNSGITFTGTGAGTILNNTMDNCSIAINLSSGTIGTNAGNAWNIYGNLITNAATGISGRANFTANFGEDYNGFYNNTANTSNWTLGAHDVTTLTTTPYTNSAGLDFSLNNVATGGKLLRGTGGPTAYPVLVGTSAPDIGAFQSTASGGGQSAYSFIK